MFSYANTLKVIDYFGKRKKKPCLTPISCVGVHADASGYGPEDLFMSSNKI